MPKKVQMKRTQVKGERFTLPREEVSIEKLIQKGLTLENKAKEIKQELDEVKERLIEVATARRDGTTTVSLAGISGDVLVTYRESYVCGPGIESLRIELRDMFPRFFTKKEEYSTTKELVKFLESEHGLGLENAEAVKEMIRTHLTKKEIKPNVKITHREA